MNLFSLSRRIIFYSQHPELNCLEKSKEQDHMLQGQGEKPDNARRKPNTVLITICYYVFMQ